MTIRRSADLKWVAVLFDYFSTLYITVQRGILSKVTVKLTYHYSMALKVTIVSISNCIRLFFEYKTVDVASQS